MKRVTVWLDCRENQVNEIVGKLRTFLENEDIEFTILENQPNLERKERSK